MKAFDSSKINWKRLFKWGSGFVLLFLINVFVEAVLFPIWDLNYTEKNDIYFQLWWVVVIAWLLFGLLLLKHLEKRKKT